MSKVDLNPRPSTMDTTCRACQSSDLATLKIFREREWKICTRCLYLQRFPLPTDWESVFSENTDYLYSTQSAHEFARHVDVAGDEWRAFMRCHSLQSNSRVLDFGSGEGPLLEYLGNNGVDASGLEPSKHTASFSKQRGHEVHNGFLSKSTYPKYSFGVVHTKDAAMYLGPILEILGFVRDILKPDGRLFWSEREYRWSADYRLSELLTEDNLAACVFSQSSIYNILALSGFEVDSFKSSFGRFHVVAKKTDRTPALRGSYAAERAYIAASPIINGILRLARSARNRVSRPVTGP